jgi:hypothetical protein
LNLGHNPKLLGGYTHVNYFLGKTPNCLYQRP